MIANRFVSLPSDFASPSVPYHMRSIQLRPQKPTLLLNAPPGFLNAVYCFWAFHFLLRRSYVIWPNVRGPSRTAVIEDRCCLSSLSTLTPGLWP